MRRKRNDPKNNRPQYAAMLTCQSSTPVTRGDDGILERLAGVFADCLSPEPPSVRLGKSLGISAAAADAILAGQKPITARMLAKLGTVMNVSADWLLTGEGSPDRPSLEHDEQADAKQFLNAFRDASPIYQQYAVFVIAFDRVMKRLPREICLRALSGLVPFAQMEAHDWLRGAIGRNLARLGSDAGDLCGLTQIFTPVHEALGVYGPEASGSLDSWLGSPA